MIRQILQNNYPDLYGIPKENIHVDVCQYNGIVKLCDEKACEECQKNRPERSECNKITLIVDASIAPVDIINFESYAKQFDGTAAALKDRCDYLLVDATAAHDKIAFCDLTCSEEKYVTPNKGKYPLGKRAKAVKQMKSSLESLLRNDFLAQNLLTFPRKICLFGWRDYDGLPVEINSSSRTPLNSMRTFMTTPSAKSGRLSTDVRFKFANSIGHDFTFVQVKYPQVYLW